MSKFSPFHSTSGFPWVHDYRLGAVVVAASKNVESDPTLGLTLTPLTNQSNTNTITKDWTCTSCEQHGYKDSPTIVNLQRKSDHQSDVTAKEIGCPSRSYDRKRQGHVGCFLYKEASLTWHVNVFIVSDNFRDPYWMGEWVQTGITSRSASEGGKGPPGPRRGKVCVYLT